MGHIIRSYIGIMEKKWKLPYYNRVYIGLIRSLKETAVSFPLQIGPGLGWVWKGRLLGNLRTSGSWVVRKGIQYTSYSSNFLGGGCIGHCRWERYGGC